MNKVKSTFSLKNIVLFLLGVVILVLYFAPIFWIFATSLRLPKDSFRWPPSFLPTSFHIENYAAVFKGVPYFMFIINSLKVGLIVMVGQVVINSMMAYAFSRLEFKGRDGLFFLVLAGLMVPTQASIIPLFMVVKMMNMTNNHIALILPALMSPLAVFMLKQSMVTISKSYEEAAAIDGASIWYRFSRVILPMCKPAVALVAILAFLYSWNDYFRPLIFISKFDKMTLPVGIQMLKGFMGNGSVSVILAGVMMSLIPPLIIFLLAQENIMKGLRSGGIKG